MKKLIFIFVAIFAFIISSCSSKSTSIEEQVSKVLESKTEQSLESLDEKIERLNSTLEKIYFDFDQFSLNSQAQRLIGAHAIIFNGEVPSAGIIIEGNCDEWGSDEYNQALGLKRAKAVKDALIARGVNEERINIKSYGEANPVCNEKSKECDAQNRRAEFKIIK